MENLVNIRSELDTEERRFQDLPHLLDYVTEIIEVWSDLASSNVPMHDISIDQANKATAYRDLLIEVEKKVGAKSPIGAWVMSRAFEELNIVTHHSAYFGEARDGQVHALSKLNEVIISKEKIFSICQGYRNSMIVFAALSSPEFHEALLATPTEVKLAGVSDEADRLKGTVGSLSEGLAKSFKAVDDLQENTMPELEKKLDEYKGRIEEIYNISNITLADAKQSFQQKVGDFEAAVNANKNLEILDQPLNRWKREMDVRGRSAKRGLFAAAISAGVTILLTPSASIGIYKLATWLGISEFGGVPKLVMASATALICLTFGIWASRIAVRYYMTEQHLINDAANRIAIANAFIKLQATLGLADDDRKLMLQTIFRPSSDGLVSDDGLPNGHPASLLVELIHPKAK